MDRTLLALLSVAIVGLTVGFWRADGPISDPPSGEAAELEGVLGGGESLREGYAWVTGPRPLRFPEDHAAHPAYRSEWWYFTGNLATAQGRRFGFQLTFFRFALAPSMPARASEWATRQAWMAHFAITDVEAGRHRAVERFQRGALELAGATTEPLRIWLDDWEAEGSNGALFPLRLQAAQDGMTLDLRLVRTKPIVLQGDRGYSRKSDAPGNASYYYSYSRLGAEGSVSIGGRTYAVDGTAWLDREWSTSALGPQQKGWDWFALQLDDGRDLMLYRLRRRDGQTDVHSAGVVVGADGAVRHLAATDFALVPARWWRSPVTGVSYPVAWRVRVPSAELDLRVTTPVPDQEMRLTYRYWEGAVAVEGDDVSGVGYLEMTGYGQ